MAPLPIAWYQPLANLMQHLAIVVSVSTLSALGVPVWVLLQYGADFRWLSGRADSPWYPTARLFRQPRYGDWAGALAEVNAALAQRRDRPGPLC